MIENKMMFLESVKAALKEEHVQWEGEITVEQWADLFKKARVHHVLPMIFESIYTCSAAKAISPQMLIPIKYQVVQDVTMQAMKTHDFLDLYHYLEEHGIKPIVVKGIICRNIYPKPDHRLSGDEDIWVPVEQFAKCHELLLAYNMKLSVPDTDIESSYEVAYGKAGSPMYIEVHKSLFPPESEAYGDWNRFFQGEFNRMITIEVEGTMIHTMPHTDHIFYLICHAFKHFLHSGFGIRQVCDIVMYANTYGKEIDWNIVYNQCKEIHAEFFAAALFQIGENYLGFLPEQACMTKKWLEIKVDETALLEDVLSGGVYGAVDANRLHSSNITLNAVSAHKKGKKASGSVLKTLFPSAKNLSSQYQYLKKYPFLLPVAWISRILNYRKELKITKNSAAESINIGNKRIELLKMYKIIK